MAPERAGAPPAETPIRRLAHFWLVDAPRRLNWPLPRVTDILVDGAWTAAWAPVAAFAPLAAFAVGLLAPLLWPGIDTVFSESLPFMMLVSMTALLSGPAGLILWLGYMPATWCWEPRPTPSFGAANLSLTSWSLWRRGLSLTSCSLSRR